MLPTIPTSGILLVAVLVLLFAWVRRLDRRHRPRVVAQVLARDVLENPEPAFPRDHVLLRQRTDMNSTPSPTHPGSASGPAEGLLDERPVPASVEGVRVPRPARAPRTGQNDDALAPTPPVGGIRRGRTVVALGAVVALALGLLTALLAPFTAIVWTLPVFLIVLGTTVLGCLRYLAVTERSARPIRSVHGAGAEGSSADSAATGSRRTLRETASTASSTDSTSAGAESAAEDRPTASSSEVSAGNGHRLRPRAELFDHQSEDHEEVATQALDLSGSGFRAPDAHSVEEGTVAASSAPRSAGDPVRTDLEMLREQARRVAAGKTAEFTPSGSTWEPVAVPRPTYVDAPEAVRAAPEPLEIPAQPVSTTSSLSEAAARGLDLDDVLSRRRA